MTTENRILCVHHADCQDGFAAAWVVRRRFGDGVEFTAARYGDVPKLSLTCGGCGGTGNVGWASPESSGKCTDCLGTGYELGGGPFLGRDVLIVDFSYPRSTLEAMAREARSVLVLDHHKSARDDLAGLPEPGDGWEEWVGRWHSLVLTLSVDGSEPVPQPRNNLAAIFDLDRSGAGLTRDFLHPGAPRSRLIDLVEDRDLWRFRHDPDTRRFHAVAASHGYEATAENFARWDNWARYAESYEYGLSRKHVWPIEKRGQWNELLAEGAAILRYEAKLLDGILRATRRTMRIGGQVVPVACVPGALASEVGNRLCNVEYLSSFVLRDAGNDIDEEQRLSLQSQDDVRYEKPPFAATYYDGATYRHFSLRSPPDGADVSEIARRYGGGGHEHAAGFAAPIGWEGE